MLLPNQDHNNLNVVTSVAVWVCYDHLCTSLNTYNSSLQCFSTSTIKMCVCNYKNHRGFYRQFDDVRYWYIALTIKIKYLSKSTSNNYRFKPDGRHSVEYVHYHSSPFAHYFWVTHPVWNEKNIYQSWLIYILENHISYTMCDHGVSCMFS